LKEGEDEEEEVDDEKVMNDNWRIFQLVLDSAGLYCLWKIGCKHFFSIVPCSGPSMYPTIQYNGDYLLVSKLHRYGRGVKVGDIVTVRNPFLFRSEAGKRVLGMPGDYVLYGEPNGDVPLEQGEDALMIQVRNRSSFHLPIQRRACFGVQVFSRDVCSVDSSWWLGS
jgi:inner membrane protease subunit 1